MKKIVVFLLILVFLSPFAYFIVASVAVNYRFPLLWPEGWTMDNWQQIFRTNNGLFDSVFTSLLISVVTAAVSTSAGFVISKTLAYHTKRSLFNILAYLPYSFSPVIYAYCLYFFFNKSQLSGHIVGVLLAQFILTFPFSIILFLNHWNTELKAVEELTYTLGGSVTQAWRRVIIPMSKSILLLCFFQTFLISWFEYGLTSVIGLGKVHTLTIKVYQYIGESNLGFAALASCLLVFPPLILLWFNRHFMLANNNQYA